MRSSVCRLAAFLMVAVLSFVHAAHGAPPATFTTQGYLTTSTGTPVTGTLVMTFDLYAAESGGVALWSETQFVVVKNGQYSAALGNTTPLSSLTFDQTYWLGVTVGTDGEMSPRQALASVPYSMTATTAKVSGTATNSQSALGTIDSALAKVSTARARFGAAMNRFDITTSNIQTARLNVSAAASRIKDVDVAEETASLSKSQVLTQAATSVLSQANSSPQAALMLIR